MQTTATETRYAAIAAGVLLLAAAEGYAGPPGWRLAWSDDFDRFNEENWTRVDTNVPTNESLQDYLPEQVRVEDGKLVITAVAGPSRGLAYRSGQVISRREQRLGRWEVRAKLPTSRGMWPAIWLLPDTDRYPWPTGGEIDILENRGDQPLLTSSAFHYGGRDPYWHEFTFGEQQTGKATGPTNYHDSFHTYTVDWSEHQLRFYVDGMHHFSVEDNDVGGFLSEQAAPMQLVINNAIGGTFLEDPDNTTRLPQRMEVDWVRVYEPQPETFRAELTNGGFEEESPLSGWTVFGNRLHDHPNVCVLKAPVRGQGAALKMFGAFAGSTSYSGVSQGITVTSGAEVRASLSSLMLATDSLAGTRNSVELKIEFYNAFGAKHGSEAMLGEESTVFASAKTTPNLWRPYRLSARAPKSAVEARVAVVFVQPANEGGAVFVDNLEVSASAPSTAARREPQSSSRGNNGSEAVSFQGKPRVGGGLRPVRR